MLMLGMTWSWLVTVLLATGLVWSDCAFAVSLMVYGVAEIASDVLVFTVSLTVAVWPGANVPMVHVTKLPLRLHEVPPVQLL